MTLPEKIIALYPELTMDDFLPNRTIRLQTTAMVKATTSPSGNTLPYQTNR
jgi:hypothetical protein